MNKYLIETESKEHVFAMNIVTAKTYEEALVSLPSGLRPSLVACNKTAPEYRQKCHRELIG